MLEWAASKSACMEANVQASLMSNLACVAGNTCGPHSKCDTPGTSHLVVLHPGKCCVTPGFVGEACS